MRRDAHDNGSSAPGCTLFNAHAATMPHGHLRDECKAQTVMTWLLVLVTSRTGGRKSFEGVFVHPLSKTRPIINNPDDGLAALFCDVNLDHGSSVIESVGDEGGK